MVELGRGVDERAHRAPWKRSARLANLFGEQALFLLRRADGIPPRAAPATPG